MVLRLEAKQWDERSSTGECLCLDKISSSLFFYRTIPPPLPLGMGREKRITTQWSMGRVLNCRREDCAVCLQTNSERWPWVLMNSPVLPLPQVLLFPHEKAVNLSCPKIVRIIFKSSISRSLPSRHRLPLGKDGKPKRWHPQQCNGTHGRRRHKISSSFQPQLLLTHRSFQCLPQLPYPQSAPPWLITLLLLTGRATLPPNPTPPTLCAMITLCRNT
jgi:hypothetical protein